MFPKFQGKKNYSLPRLFGRGALGCQRGSSLAAAPQFPRSEPEGFAEAGAVRRGQRAAAWAALPQVLAQGRKFPRWTLCPLILSQG